MAESVGTRRTWQLALGVGLLIGFLIAAIGLWIGADRLYDNNVAGFARAPVGCDTTLDFDRTGEFFLFVETNGQLDVVSGDCGASSTYNRKGAIPQVQLVLRDPSGGVVEMESSMGLDYDTSDYVGTSNRSVQIADTGDYVLTVGPVDGAEFAVAIGRDPSDGVGLMRWGALAALVVGFLLGGLFLVLGSRRSVANVDDPTPWQPTAPAGPQAADWPSGPPGFPMPPPTTGATGVGAPGRGEAYPAQRRPIVSPPQAPAPQSKPEEEPRSPWAPPPTS
jgi:hypothetical protein